MANNNFIKYPSIGNYKDSNKIVEILRSEEILDKCDWVVSEKIHGANFSFITNGNSVVCAKRSGIIKPEEIFFCYQKVYEKYKDSIMKLWKEMDHQQEIRGLNNQIIVYGELFGGYYPHPHVKQVEGVKPVQKGICYCPGIEWKAFDIYDGEDFVEWDKMKTLFDNCNVPFVKELSRGSFLSCINYDPNFNTLIPQDFSLALIQSNKAEGIVIRPLNLDSKKFGHVMLKIKSEDFEERLRRKPKLGDFSSLSMSIQPDLFLNFINKNRLESVISKEGSLGRENEDRFLRLLVEDALKDIKECSDIGKKYLSMSKSNKEKVHHLLFAEGKKVIQKYIEDDLVNL